MSPLPLTKPYSIRRFLPKGPLWQLENNPLFSEVVERIEDRIESEYRKIRILYKEIHPYTATPNSPWYKLFKTESRRDLLSKITSRRKHRYQSYLNLIAEIDPDATITFPGETDKADGLFELVMVDNINHLKFKEIRSAIDNAKQFHVTFQLLAPPLPILSADDLRDYLSYYVDYFSVKQTKVDLSIADVMQAGSELGDTETTVIVSCLPEDYLIVLSNIQPGSLPFNCKVVTDNSLY